MWLDDVHYYLVESCTFMPCDTRSWSSYIQISVKKKSSNLVRHTHALATILCFKVQQGSYSEHLQHVKTSTSNLV